MFWGLIKPTQFGAEIIKDGSKFYLDDARSIMELKLGLLMEHLPKGVWSTTDGGEYYFNYNENVVFAYDVVTRKPLPVTPDMQALDIPNIDHAQTRYYYLCPPDLVATDNVPRMHKLAGPEPSIELLSQVLQDAYAECGEHINSGRFARFDGPVSEMHRKVLLTAVLEDVIPEGYYENEDGLQYYFSANDVILFGWNPKMNAYIPTHRGMSRSDIGLLAFTNMFNNYGIYDLIDADGRETRSALRKVVAHIDKLRQKADANN